jgi:tetratricopeptide (TPR) repeat protein
MRTKTVKRLAILIAVLSLIGGTGFIGWKYQIERMSRDRLEKAKRAEEAGNFVEAENLYRQYRGVIPENVEVNIKYADLLLKGGRTSKRGEALAIYSGILRAKTGRDDVRRKLMQLKIDLGLLTTTTKSGMIIEGADLDLNVLLERPPGDDYGELLFLRGRCDEARGDWEKAAVGDAKHAGDYENAIKYNAPQRIEAYQRRAVLLRDRIKPPQPKKADQVIQGMVQSDPKNYKVYLARGQYLLSDPDQSKRASLRQAARDDFRKALQRAPAEPEIYLALAGTFDEEDNSERDKIRQILEDGRQKAPKSLELCKALARVELRARRVDKAMEILEDGVKKVPEPVLLRFLLAVLLADQKANSKLDAQIVELRKLDCNKSYLDYLTALYYININDFAKARQYLLPLQGDSGLPPDYKVLVNNRLAQCFEQLGEPERAQQFYRQALIDNPKDRNATLGRIPHLLEQGATEEAINEYRALVKDIPGVRLDLARLLIARNGQLRESQPADWSEAKRLIEEAGKAAPESVDPVILEADLLWGQGKADEALKVLEKARSRFPKSVEPWTAQAKRMGQQGRVDEALSLVDQAQRQLGDRVGLRLARADLWGKKTGPQVLQVWNDLSQNMRKFSKVDRRRLLVGLAAISRQRDPAQAGRLLSQLAEEDPDNIKIRLALFELALGSDNKDEIKKNIEQIRRIEGNEGMLSRYCEALCLIKQAEQARDDRKKQEELRTSARVLLNELLSRRRDWSLIPKAFGDLEEQELSQDRSLPENERRLTGTERKAKEESILNYYLQAISLGQRQPALVHRVVQLLFETGRGNEVVEFLKTLPAELRTTVDLARLAAQFAVEKNWKLAEQAARQVVAANPGDFEKQLLLVEILLDSGRQADAEKGGRQADAKKGGRQEAEVELRKAVDLSPRDPNRWVALVRFMVLTEQFVKAEQAIRDAEANLPQPQAPLALAQCCDLVGQAYDKGNGGEAAKKWYADAKRWYKKALAAQPDDLSIRYLLTEFFRRTNQVSEARSQLDAILKHRVGAKRPDIVAWANRERALRAASDPDYREVRKALSYFEPPGQPAAIGQEGKSLKDPEDLRVLTRVLELQKTREHRKRAIEILESLTEKKPASYEDQFRLARLYEMSHDWPKARATYDELSLQLKNTRDLENLSRRAFYLRAFAEGLLQQHRPGETQELIKAQQLIDEIQQLQPDALSTLALQVELDRAHNRLESAAKRIQDYADRPKQTPQALEILASLAEEKLSRMDLAEKLYRRAALSGASQGKITLAKFLGRHDHPKEGLDILEPLRSDTRATEVVVDACNVLLRGKSEPDPAQLNRGCGWLEQALKQKPGSVLLSVCLANLRERQERYQEAEDLYRSVIQLSDGNTAPGDLQTIVTSYNNLAWLMSVYDRKGHDALPYVNHAIELAGPLPDFLDTRGIVYLTVGDFQHAIDDLERAVDLAPTPHRYDLAPPPSSHMYFHLAQAYLAAGNKEKARQSLKAARIKGWEESGLHPLEKDAYQKVLAELGVP